MIIHYIFKETLCIGDLQPTLNEYVIILVTCVSHFWRCKWKYTKRQVNNFKLCAVCFKCLSPQSSFCHSILVNCHRLPRQNDSNLHCSSWVACLPFTVRLEVHFTSFVVRISFYGIYKLQFVGNWTAYWVCRGPSWETTTTNDLIGQFMSGDLVRTGQWHFGTGEIFDSLISCLSSLKLISTCEGKPPLIYQSWLWRWKIPFRYVNWKNVKNLRESY